MSCDSDSIFPLGSLVVIECGKNAGLMCAVIGTDAERREHDKILIADGRKISVRHPKAKNPKHLRHTGTVSAEIASQLARGKRLDDGWLNAVLMRSNNDKITACS